MRILHLASYSLFSGPLPSTLGLALAQRELGHTVQLSFDTKRGAINAFEEPAAPRLLPYGLLPEPPLVMSTKSSPLELWRDARRVRQLMLEVDVVHTHLSHDHSLMVMATPRARRALRVRTFHATRSLDARLGQSFMNRRADAWIVRSGAHRELLLERFGVPEARVHVIPGGIDAQSFAPASEAERRHARHRFGLPEDAFVIGHVALMASRGQVELVSALKSLPEPRPHLLFVGKGEHEGILRAHVSATGMTRWVHFAGYLLGPELRQGYVAMDAAFLAQAGNDASARAALEAMAMQLPLVAVATGALAELASPERALPIVSRAPEVIAAGLAQVMSDAGARARLAEAARRFVATERSFEQEALATLRAYGS